MRLAPPTTSQLADGERGPVGLGLTGSRVRVAITSAVHTCGAVELRHVLGARQFERSWFEHELFPLAERLERTPAAALPQVLAGKQLFFSSTSLNGLRRLRQHLGTLRAPVHFIGHHDAHNWSAYGLSGFDDVLVLVMDGRGASQSNDALSRARR